MRLLVVSDIHGSNRAIERVRWWAKEHSVDAIIICGDITNFGPASWARELLSRLDTRVLAIPGNCDPEDIVQVLKDCGVNLHAQRVNLGGYTFAGLGGSNPTPFRTPFELAEEEIFRALDGIMDNVTVLVSHSPPLGHVDFIPGSGHMGSKGVSRIVQKYRPKLVLCGHIHEGRGFEPGETSFLNPGPARNGCGALVDLDSEVRAQLLL